MANAVKINASDNVMTAIDTLKPGDEIMNNDGEIITVKEKIPFGHKVALRTFEVGQSVIKYDRPIGTTTDEIEPGEHVHTHNIESNYGRGDRE